MAKYQVVINNGDVWSGKQSHSARRWSMPAEPAIITGDYSHASGRTRWHRAIRIADLHSLNGIAVDDLDSRFVEYNGSGYWFIQIRPDVTLEDFEFTNLV